MQTGSKAEGGPRLIGIAGPSCSGKTTLARALSLQLCAPTAVLPMDAYYRDLTGLPTAAKAASNFDDPAAFDYELLVLHIEQLAAGNSIECPVYDFATHTRQKAIEHIVPTPYLIVEGLFALYWPLINNLYDLRLFIATDDNLCLKRRVNRDCKERERSPESVQKQYHSHVRPMYQRHILPTARKADLLLDGVNSPQQQIDLIISTLKLQS